MEEAAGITGLNPSFGFNTFGYAPYGFVAPVNPQFGLTLNPDFGHVTPNTPTPPNFSFSMPVAPPDKMTTIDQALHDAINQDPDTVVDPNMEVVDPSTNAVQALQGKTMTDPHMQALPAVPAPSTKAMPIAFQQVETLEEDRQDPDKPTIDPNLAPPTPLNKPDVLQAIPLTQPFPLQTLDKNIVDPFDLMDDPDKNVVDPLSITPPALKADPFALETPISFQTPMSMQEALDATVTAMNPAMSSPDDSDDGGSVGGGIGSDGGGGGAEGGGSASGTGGIGSDGGGGGAEGGGSASGTGGIGSEGGGMGGQGGAGGPGSPGEGGSPSSGPGGIGSEGGGMGGLGGAGGPGPGDGGPGEA